MNICVLITDIRGTHQSQLCSVWSAFSRPLVMLGIPTTDPVAVVSVNLLVVLVFQSSLFNSYCDYYFLRPRYIKNMKQS